MPAVGEPPPPGEQLLTMSQRVEDGAIVIQARGEVDTLTAPRLSAAVDGALRSATGRRVVVDLLGVSFLGSAGLAVLARAAEQARQRYDEPLRIVVDHNRPVVRPLRLTGLDEVLQLCGSLDEALTA